MLLRLKSLVERLEELDKQDAQIRAELRHVGHTLMALADEAGPSSPADNAPKAPATTPPSMPAPTVPAPPAPAPSVPPPAPLVPSTLSPPVPASSSPMSRTPSVSPAYRVAAPESSPLPPSFGPTVTDEDLPIIEARCRLKAEAARFAAARLVRLRDGDDSFADFEANYHDLIARAKALPDCFLWMCRSEDFRDADAKQFDDLAGCFDAAAHVLRLLQPLVSSPESDSGPVEQAILLCAEAQSAIWKAVANVSRLQDADQRKLFDWLKDTAGRRRVWLDRFMTRVDPADPACWRDLEARIAALESRQQELQARERQRRKLFNKIRYLLKRITEQPGADHVDDWASLVSAVVELVKGGLPPSNVELRDLLLPMLDDLPDLDETPPEFRLVLRETDRYLASLPSRSLTVATTFSDDARRVARLLRGKAVALIGGAPRAGAKEALEEAFGLSELIWLENRDQSYSQFAPHIARADVAVVLLAIRWSRHGFGEIKKDCDQHDKPLVRLPGGYNPNQVAHQILAQVGERLAGNLERVGPGRD